MQKNNFPCVEINPSVRPSFAETLENIKEQIEYDCFPTGMHKGRVNWHYHIFVTGGLDNRTMERLWDKGVRVNCDNFQPERFGPEAAAKYMLKSNVQESKKKYICSRNMESPRAPDPSKRDGRTSQYQLERWAKERIKGLIHAAFEYTKSHCTNEKMGADQSALTGGNQSALTGGDWSVVYGGEGAKVRGGLRSVLAIQYWKDFEFQCIKFKEVDGKKIKPDTWYKLDKAGRFIEVKDDEQK